MSLRFISCVIIGILFFFPIDVGVLLKTNRLASIILAFLGLMNFKFNISIILLSLILFSYILLVLLFSSYADFTLLVFLFELFVVTPLACFGFARLIGDYQKLSKVIITVALCQAVMIGLMLFFPVFQDFYLSLIVEPNVNDLFSFRKLGFTGFTSYNMGVFFVVVIMILFLTFAKSQIGMTKLGLFFFIFVSAAVVSSRSSMVVLPIVLVFGYLSFAFRRKRLTFFVLGGTVFLLVSVLGVSFIDEQRLSFILLLFDSIVIKGNLPVDVTGIFTQQYFLPELETLLFGDGIYYDFKKGTYYNAVDPGYMRFILYMGLMGSFILVFVFSLVWRQISYNINFRVEKLFFFFFYLVCAVMLMKGSFLIDGSESIKVVMLVYFCAKFGAYTHRKTPAGTGLTEADVS